ncbi:MAG TPA: 30S ribosomal protein S16 [bacterium]|nr:30S ribosomal protein S16 [bacterium]
MAVSIRLSRRGRKAVPHYYIIVQDKEKSPKGSFIEKLGFYNPSARPVILEFDVVKAEQWIKNGAKPSVTVARLIQVAKEGIKDKGVKHKKFGGKFTPEPAAEPAEAPSASQEQPAEAPAASEELDKEEQA